MTMRRTVVAATATAALALAMTGRAQEPRDHEARMAEWDKGPATIDVSEYPPEMKARYKLVAEKCGKCHTLARAINSDLVLEDELERLVRRTARRSGTFIKPDEAKEIFEFLVYDAKVRRSELYERRLKESAESPDATR